MDKYVLVRQIPSIETLVKEAGEREGFDTFSHDVLVDLFRHAVQKTRESILSQVTCEEEKYASLSDEIFRIVEMERKRKLEPNLKRVINATGIVLHTNLGRAPLGCRARQLVDYVLEGYSNLEYDLITGKRSERQLHIAERLAEATGAEAALAVNNNAAAILLVLTGLARGREVIVSRGELVEIGGSFRVPEVLAQSGAHMIEVGTTNKTRIEDYCKAITPNTAAILKVHTSNFRIVGFTGEPKGDDVCKLAHKHSILAINDLGSGTLEPYESGGYREPSVKESIEAGFDIVTFSGDKLLGGGQAGLIAGKRELVSRLKKEPLMRAVRIDKLSLAALEGTLIDYATGCGGSTIPSWRMLKATREELHERAKKLQQDIICKVKQKGWIVHVVETKSLAGGGALPAVELSGYGVQIIPDSMSAAELDIALRQLTVPVVGLVRDGAVILDVRCLNLGEDEIIGLSLEKIRRGEEA